MPKHPPKHPHPQDPGNTGGQPVFAQPQPSPDPTGFRNPVTDQKQKGLAVPEPVPQSSGGAVEPILTLQQVYGQDGPARIQDIEQTGQIVFHSVGDTGSVVGPATQSLVADKMVADFNEPSAADVPSFFFHLGVLFRRGHLLLRPVL